MSSFTQVSRRLSWLALVLVLMAAAALPIDVYAANQWMQYPKKGVAFHIANLSESFGHGLGVAWVLLTVATLDPLNRHKLGPLAVLAFGGGLVSNVFKLTVQRWRPLHFHGGDSVWDTFAGWPIVGMSDSSLGKVGNALQSFPSGHAATAAGLAIGLTLLYPRGRWLFIAGATLGILQRQVVRAHFASDTLVGAAIGCLWAAVWLHPRLLGRMLTSQSDERTPSLSAAMPNDAVLAS